MSFNENLQSLRKNKNISQEQLAEKLEVSRQAISKWESGTGYPEMDKLLKICEIFDCSLDTIMKGKISEDKAHEKKVYENFFNTFSKGMSLAVGIILFAITIQMFLLDRIGLFGMNEDQLAILGTVIILFGVCLAVPVFIILGIKNEQFREKYLKMPEVYTEYEKDKFNNKYPITVAFGVVLILIGVIILVAMYGMGLVSEESTLPVSILLLLVTVAVMDFVYYGIQKDKYDIAKYNKTKVMENENPLVGKICGVIMMIATIFFLIGGLVLGLWNIAWIVYPIGGILCGIVSTVLAKEE